MDRSRTVHLRIEGRVQGVGYRAWLKATAMALGPTGWVRNRRDRSVEAVLQGPPDQVADMLRRCEDGPPSARVTCVELLAEGAASTTPSRCDPPYSLASHHPLWPKGEDCRAVGGAILLLRQI